MKVAVWYDERFGPAVLAVIPQDDEKPPDFATIPYKIPPGIRQQFMAKGHAVDWDEWAEHLTGRQPHHGQWSVEDAPDGMTAQQALSQVRKQAGDRATASS